MRKASLALILVLAACGGGGSGGQPGLTITPVPSGAQALRGFMAAAADSNLSRMAELWGTPDGPAIQTGKPNGWEKRVAIMQAYLKNDSTRVVSDMPIAGSADQRRVVVNVYRSGCAKQVPAIVARTRAGGWIITDIDISAAGNPARPCESD